MQGFLQRGKTRRHPPLQDHHCKLRVDFYAPPDALGGAVGLVHVARQGGVKRHLWRIICDAVQDCLYDARLEERLILEINHLLLQPAQHQGRATFTRGFVVHNIRVVNVFIKQLQ